MRVLTDPDIPPSAGAYRPIEVLAPEGSLLNARSPAAVVGGNVETSCRVADLVLAAFGRALGQGTMNNLTLGTEDFTYYETLGGGQGACPDADGPSAVHVAMSNTLNTPVEALELEFPLRVTRYAVRRGCGGAGAHRGGDGVVRELEALRADGLLADHRAPPPRAAGRRRRRAGARGRNLLDGDELAAKATGELRARRAPDDRDAGRRRPRQPAPVASVAEGAASAPRPAVTKARCRSHARGGSAPAGRHPRARRAWACSDARRTPVESRMLSAATVDHDRGGVDMASDALRARARARGRSACSDGRVRTADREVHVTRATRSTETPSIGATWHPATSDERIGFVGLGIMGSRQAANLARAGHELTVFNRTRATAEAWVAEHGGDRRRHAGARSARRATS